MAYYLAELYTPRPAWLALDANARQQYLAAVATGMAGLSALGIEAITLGATDAGLPYAPTQTFFALWKCPEKPALDALVGGIAASGWHDYFETVNAGGEGTDFAGHLAQLASV